MSDNYQYNKKWRATHRETYDRGKKRYYSQFQGKENSRKPWTGSEEKQVLAREVSDRELSEILQRSVAAIQIRRNRLTKEVPDADS